MGSSGSQKAPPKPPAIAAPITNEDENVKEATEKERRRIKSQKGRTSTQLLTSEQANQTKATLG